MGRRHEEHSREFTRVEYGSVENATPIPLLHGGKAKYAVV
jgi:hypothetical protein